MKMKDTDLDGLERVRAKLERSVSHVMSHIVQDAIEEIISLRAETKAGHPIDQLWGHFDDVTIRLVPLIDSHGHYWSVKLPQADVLVEGHPNDPNVGEVIATAIKQAKAKQAEPEWPEATQ